MVVKANGETRQEQWWETADHLVTVPTSYDEQVAVFKDLFRDALKLRLRSDVNIASALSGGLDSSSVFAGVHHIAEGKEKIYRMPGDCLKAFVAVFPGTEQDERIFADSVLEYVNGEAIYVDCNYNKDIQSKLIPSIRTHDSISTTPLFILDSLYAAMRNQDIIVSMDGHGVDEMMYGYPFNVLNAYGHQLGNLQYAKEIKDIYINMLPPDDKRDFKKSIQFQNRLYRVVKRNAIKLITGEQKKQWLNENLTQSVQLPDYKIPSNFSGSEAQLYHDFHFTTLPTILRNFDRAAMRSGVEIRMPFLDYRLVTFVFSLSMQSKLGNGFAKRILRDAMKGVLPEFVRTRTLKTGFNAPLKSWFQSELKEFLLDEVSSAEFIKSNLWNGPLIRDFVISKTKLGNWTNADSVKLWPVLNAHLLFKN
jgi:asparagine synthase (glutamine-hydrolysing)